MDAIVYTTNTGSSERYADLLAHEMQLPVYSLAEVDGRLRQGAEIIYLGWVMASSVKGYAAAAKRYSVRAVCPVGMGQTGTQTEQIRAKNNIPAEVPVFTLQGNFDLKKLSGMYRLMMNIMVSAVGKKLSAKPDRTPEEDDMLDMMLTGSERVSFRNLKAVLDWYAGLKK